MVSRIITVGLLVTVLGCSTESPMEPANEITSGESIGDVQQDEGMIAPEVLARWRHRDPMKFEVRVENVSTDMTLPISTGGFAPIPLSPGMWAITRAINPLFKVGHYDQGLGLEQLAEDGNPANMYANLSGKRGIKSSGVFNTPEGAAGPSPAFSGQSFVFMVEAKPGDNLSLCSMFAQSNDLFYAPAFFGVPLFDFWGRPKSGDVTNHFYLWDAGTEVNEEPGIGPNQAPRQSGPNTGPSEHKRVWFVHDGYTYPDKHDVIKVTVTPMDGA